MCVYTYINTYVCFDVKAQIDYTVRVTMLWLLFMLALPRNVRNDYLCCTWASSLTNVCVASIF